MPDIRKALGAFRLPRRHGVLTELRAAPLIAELEAILTANRRIEWTAAFEAKCDAASLAVFGITQTDTRPREPHPDDVPDNTPTARFFMGDAAFADYNHKLGAWYHLTGCIGHYEEDVGEAGACAYWRGRGYDVGDEFGEELACFRHLSRQMYVAANGLLPGAKVTLDGSGHRAPQSVDDWAAALEAEARRFRPGR
jgi:hypothetical protein